MKLTRLAIVRDDSGDWFVRHIRVTEHDCALDEKVYRCDFPVGTRCATLDGAVEVAKKYLAP